MAQHLWSLLCEKPLLDSQTNQISLIGIVEQFNVLKVPTLITKVTFVVSLWEKDSNFENEEERFKHRIQISPQSQEYTYKPCEYDNLIPKEKKRIGTCNGIEEIPVSEEGHLFFHIELFEENEWKEIYKFAVDIRKE